MRLLLLASAALLLASCEDDDSGSTGWPPPRPPSSSHLTAGNWELGPPIRQQKGEPKTPSPASDGIFQFQWKPRLTSIHYVTYPHGSLTGATQIRMRYRIDAEEGAFLYGTRCPETTKSFVSIYFQRHGDTWFANDEYEAYRWWFRDQRGATTPGTHEIVAPLNGMWGAISGSISKPLPVGVDPGKRVYNPEGFREAVLEAQRVGFTFSNCDGLGHGAMSTGPVKFTLLEWEIK